MPLPARIKNWLRPARPAGGLRGADGRFAEMGETTREAVRASLLRHYFTAEYALHRESPTVEAYLATEGGAADLHDHLVGRLTSSRASMIPWMADALPLHSARILEIGCGTGSSTLALAEQGASVVAMDVDAESVAVARDRCAAYGVKAEFIVGNASEVRSLAGRAFNLIIFVASLEHMTHEERLAAMADTWAMLGPGSLWGTVDTPNRLWIHDLHTAMLPFFHWLPDDLAFKYLRFSPRKTLARAYPEPTPEAQLDFLRTGRGLSYHEFHLALGDPGQLQVVGDMAEFMHRRDSLRALGRTLARRDRFMHVLMSVGPRLPRAFYRPSLDLLIRK